MSANIYLDESGDTGWLFDQPYTNGGSSRYLIIAACQLLSELDHKPERMLRNIYKNRSWKPGSEKNGRVCRQTHVQILQKTLLS